VHHARPGLTWRRLLPGIVLLLAGLACSSSNNDVADRKPVYPVRGKVLWGDKPAARAFLILFPINEPAEPKDPRPRGEVDRDGSFSLSTYGAGDGAPAGDYVVTIRWPGGHTPDGQEEPEDKLLGRYADPKRSKLKAAVKAEPNELPPFQVK
jgi:hypothetical protein